MVSDSKFTPLADFLKHSRAESITMDFTQIEEILQFPLCPSARKYYTYWVPTKTHYLPKICMEAGYKISKVDLKNSKVWFQRL